MRFAGLVLVDYNDWLRSAVPTVDSALPLPNYSFAKTFLGSRSMSQSPPILDPWRLVWGQPYIDCQTLAAAIEQDLEHVGDPDVRNSAFGP